MIGIGAAAGRKVPAANLTELSQPQFEIVHRTVHADSGVKQKASIESSALDVRLIQWNELPFRSHPKIIEIWGERDASGLKGLIDADRGNRDALRCARIRGEDGKPILFDGYGRLVSYFARKAEGCGDSVPAYTVEEFASLGDVLEKLGQIQAVRRNRTEAQIAFMRLRILEEQGYDIAPKSQGRQKAAKRTHSLKPLPSAKALAKEIGVSDPIIRATLQAMANPDETLVKRMTASPTDESYLSPAQVVRKLKAEAKSKVREAQDESRRRRQKRIAEMETPTTPDEFTADGLYAVDAITGMKRIRSGTVDLICTSIPYPCDMRYDNTPDYDGDYAQYLDTTVRPFLSAAKDALRHGGRVAVNFDCTSRQPDKALRPEERDAQSAYFNLWMDMSVVAQRELGLLFLGYRIWFKQNCPRQFSSGSRSSVVPRMNPNTEFVLIFAKGSTRLEGPSDISQCEYDRFALTNWYILPQRRKDHDADDFHPCPYPEELPYRLIRTYCPKGGLVLDPFSGSGTSAFVAKALGRPYIGLDNNPLSTEGATRRLATLDGLSAMERVKRIERFLPATEHGHEKHGRRRDIPDVPDGSDNG